jgi:hypothetical protein
MPELEEEGWALFTFFSIGSHWRAQAGNEMVRFRL